MSAGGRPQGPQALGFGSQTVLAFWSSLRLLCLLTSLMMLVNAQRGSIDSLNARGDSSGCCWPCRAAGGGAWAAAWWRGVGRKEEVKEGEVERQTRPLSSHGAVSTAHAQEDSPRAWARCMGCPEKGVGGARVVGTQRWGVVNGPEWWACCCCSSWRAKAWQPSPLNKQLHRKGTTSVAARGHTERPCDVG